MNNQHIQTEATAEQKIEQLLNHIAKTQGQLLDTKEVLKEYKIKSDTLTKMKEAKKDMIQKINEEKDRIEDELYEDPTYEKSKNDELTLKNQLKEQIAMLKVEVQSKYNAPGLKTEDHLIKGEQMKLQLEFMPNIYINGRLIK